MNGNIKNALFIVVIIAAIAGSVLLCIKPNLTERKQLETEVSDLQNKYNDLVSKEQNRPVYEAGIVQNKKKFKEILDKFPEGIEQENYIKMLGDMKDNKDLDFDISNLSFNETEPFYVLGQGAVTAEEGAAATTETTTASSETTASDANATTAAGETEATTDNTAGDTQTAVEDSDSEMQGIKENMTVDYTGKYKGIKNLLAFIMSNKDRMTVDQMNLTYDPEAKGLTGSFSFNIFAITSANRTLAEPTINGVDVGVDNIFDDRDNTNSDVKKSLSNAVDKGDNILKDYDQYIALNPSTSNASAIAVGFKGNTESEISSNENSVQNVTVKYFMVGSKYYVSYNIGDVSYPENFETGTEFDPGEALNLAITSSKRKNDKDKSGIKLVLDNETDMTLNVKIDGDDSKSPRVKISSRVGKVKVYE